MVVMGSIKQLLPLCLEVYQLFLQDGLPTKNTSLSQGTLAAHIVQDEAQLGILNDVSFSWHWKEEFLNWNPVPFGPGVPHPTIFGWQNRFPSPPWIFWKEPKVFPRISEMVSQIHRYLRFQDTRHEMLARYLEWPEGVILKYIKDVKLYVQQLDWRAQLLSWFFDLFV